jgi:integral membrane sensor domain MASE1
MSKQTNAPKFVIALAVASIYFATAYLSLFLATINNSASPFWPATGIAVAAVYVYGVSGFIGVLVGAFAGNLTTGAPIMAVVLIGVGNALESFVGSAILKYLLLNRWRASTYIRMAAVPVAGLFASAISPTMGGLALVGFGDVPWTEFSKTWITWFGGDLVGFLAVVPSLIFRDLFPDPGNTMNINRFLLVAL